MIIGRYLAGQKIKEIAEAESLKYHTVYRLIQRYKERGTPSVLLRTGRPLKATPRDIRALKRVVLQDPKLTFEALKKEADVDLSSTTIKKVLRDEGLYHWRAKGRPELTEAQAAYRL
jgi:transposase